MTVGSGGEVGGDDLDGGAFQVDDGTEALEVGGESADVAVDGCKHLGLLTGEDVLVEEVRQDGSVDEDESNLLRSAIEFTDRDAGSILTPRVDLEGVPVTATKEHIADVFSKTRYSRLLVYDGTIDSIVGVIHQKDFYVGTGVTEKDITAALSEGKNGGDFVEMC